MFLEAIRATGKNSDSDAREVYADWLEEHGRSEHAEYLRLEIEVRGFEFVTGNEDREQKKTRRDELADRFKKSDPMWLDSVVRSAGGWVTRRRPTGVGRAEPITPAPTKAPVPEPPFMDLPVLPVRSALDVIDAPDPYEIQRKEKFKGKLAIEIILAVGLALFIVELVTRGPSAVMNDAIEAYRRRHLGF